MVSFCFPSGSVHGGHGHSPRTGFVFSVLDELLSDC